MEKENREEKYLGIDWGARDVGLALADKETRVASAYSTLKNDWNLLENLAQIIGREEISVVVIGIPFYINKEDVVYEGEKLGNLLKEKLGIKVFYQNEMFTTKIAQNLLIKKGVKKIKRYDDQEAARIILQDWLDKAIET